MLSRTAFCLQHHVLTRTNAVSQKITYRTIHVACRIQNSGLRMSSALRISKYSAAMASCTKRYASTTEVANSLVNDISSPTAATNATTEASSTVLQTSTEPLVASTQDFADASIGQNLTTKVLDVIPDAPLPPAPTVIETVRHAGEIPFSELGLGAWTPPGIIQQYLELLHVSCDLPWWGAIAVATLTLRIAVFPLVVLAQRNGANMNNHMPEIARLQMEMSDARLSGDQMKAARKAQELMTFMKVNKCSPLRNMVVPMAQAPVFISVFLGLRKMADLPVESMKTGGLWWFQDLTVYDPYYVLPIVTAATLAVTIEIGTDSTRAQAMGMIRYAFRAIPVVIFPFTMHFSAAILCYWVSSNFISLLQVGLLRVPKVRTFFKIQPMIKHPPSALTHQKGFVEGMKSSVANMKAAREANARYEADVIQFNRAGRGPLKKTYAYDPTKQATANTIMAKKR